MIIQLKEKNNNTLKNISTYSLMSIINVTKINLMMSLYGIINNIYIIKSLVKLVK